HVDRDAQGGRAAHRTSGAHRSRDPARDRPYRHHRLRNHLCAALSISTLTRPPGARSAATPARSRMTRGSSPTAPAPRRTTNPGLSPPARTTRTFLVWGLTPYPVEVYNYINRSGERPQTRNGGRPPRKDQHNE